MCQDTFTCYDSIRILSYDIEGVLPFLCMVIIAGVLQFAANWVWIQSSQVTREILQLEEKDRGSCISGKLYESMKWTLISTMIWIARIILVMGSNIFIFIIVLIGNLAGVYYTQSTQKRDHQIKSLAADIHNMLERLSPDSECSSEIKCNIKQSLRELKQVLKTIDDEPEAQPMNSSDSKDTEYQGLLAF